MRYHFTPIRLATINNVLAKCGENGTLVHSKKLKMELYFDSVILLLGIYPRNPETPIQKNTYTPMCIAVLFTIAKIWK